MRRTTSVLLLAAGASAGVLGSAQQPEFRAGSAAVSIHATVIDRDGQIVTDLTRDDFEVYDNGRQQPVTVFDAGQRPISVVVMLDRSSSMQMNAPRVEAAARAFIGTLLPDDRVRLGFFAAEIQLEPETFTSDPGTLHRILDRSPEPAGATPLWRATGMALDALAHEEGQRVVLVFTDGRDTPAFSENVTFSQILSRVRREETMVYAVGLAYRCGSSDPSSSPRVPTPWWHQFGPAGPAPRQRPQFPRPPVQIPFPGRGLPPPNPLPMPRRSVSDGCRESGPDPDLRELALAGGGGYFELRSSDDLTSTFERVGRELHSQYLIGFDAPERDGTLHRIEVRVKDRDVTVRARRTYLAAPE